LSGYSPGIISWLRYNTFLVLYPLGASSEAWLVYKSIERAKKIRQEFAWVLQLILFIYIPGTLSLLS
jgi:very-long-chain (3R)-3-hydroxyacyl-CoA dehydratase